MIYLLLIYEFIRIGVFSFGGGYATIPFLYKISAAHGWYSLNDLTNMIAIASVTPGPVGINAATFAGLKTAGILGSVCATISEMLPSLFLVIIISKILNKFHENFYVKSAIETLKPISCALLLFVSVELLKSHIADIKALILLVALLLISWKSKKDPLFYMLIAGCVGVLLKLTSL